MANNVKPMKTPPQPSQLGSLDKHYAVPHTIGGKTQDNVGRQPDVQQPQNGGVATGTGPIEVHMVYAEWCGHSKRALPAFDKLVNNQSVTTKSGRKVTFVKTDEKSKDFKDFKVRGFPSYMVKDGRNIAPINVGDRSEQSIIDAVKELP